MNEHVTLPKLQMALQLKENLPLHQAALTALQSTLNASEELLRGIDLWVAGQLPEDYAMGRYTVKMVMDRYQVSSFVALEMMEAFVNHAVQTRKLLWNTASDRVTYRQEEAEQSE